jgi:diacylglycerol O-acyltransferase
VEQLSAQDASFLYLETPNAPQHVGGISIYDQATALVGKITFKGILENVEKRLHLARCFRQRLVQVPMSLDYPYWIEDPDFDLEFHVRHIALPKPGDWRQLCIQAARLHSRPLDLSRPLWEMYVVEGLDNVPGLPAGSFAVVSKIHHAAIDGVTGAEMTAALHDLAPDAEPPPPDKPWQPESVPSTWELLTRSSMNNLTQPFRLAPILAQSVPAIARVTQRLRTQQLRPPSAVPRTRFNASVSPHRVVEGRAFQLDEIRSIKNAVKGATVNDVVLAICGGALRRYLKAKGELPGESLIAMAPISVRATDERGAAGNRVSAMLVSVRSDLEDPIERLKRCIRARSSPRS